MATNPPTKVKRLAIEGNIAAGQLLDYNQDLESWLGKSTFLDMLKNYNYIVVPEPISKWQQIAEEDESNPASIDKENTNGVQLYKVNYCFNLFIGKHP